MKPWLRFALAFCLGVACQRLTAQTVDSFNPNPGNWVTTLAIQPDGKVLVGRSTSLTLARYNTDGSKDSTFSTGRSSVYALGIQEDGKILVGAESGLSRVYADGTLDSGFAPGINGTVFGLALQPDGKILVAGSFSVAGSPCTNLARLNPDGTLDGGFSPSPAGTVEAVAVQADGAILAGGAFGAAGGQLVTNLARFAADGTLDTSFAPGPSGTVFTILVQPDGRIVIGGGFTNLAGQACNRIGRLNPNGTLENCFGPGADDLVLALVLQADGKFVVGGWFEVFRGQTRNGLARLNSDGTLDSIFNPPLSGTTFWPRVYSLALQSDGRLLVGGDFTGLCGQARNGLGRVDFKALREQPLVRQDSSLTWVQQGYGPEFQRVTLSACTNGADWFSVGVATRLAAGWQLSHPLVPVNATVRAHGLVTGSGQNGSFWSVEAVTGPPVITAQPVSTTNSAGAATGFTIQAVGDPVLNYRWRRNGVALSDGTKVSGSASPVLTLSNVLSGDAGSYSVVVTNNSGSVTSAAAALVLSADPSIVIQPVSRTNNATSTANFSVTAAATGPVGYQWLKDGSFLSNGGKVTGCLTSTLTISNVLLSEAGGYSAIVTNPFSSVTSVVATLTVLDPGFASQPASQILSAGQTATFSATAVGTLPITYQWRRNGSNIDGATGTSLVLTNAQRADCANFDVIASNPAGTATSSTAGLIINFSAAEAFNPAPSPWLYCLAIQPDGKTLVGGWLNNIGGQVRSGLARLNVDGSVDAPFNPGADSYVNCLGAQPDGKVLVGGSFTKLGGRSCANLGRLNPGGTLDDTFQGTCNGSVYCALVQPDGKILLGGAFGTVDGQQRQSIARLNADGTLDTVFNPRANGIVYCIALEPDGDVLAGGLFSNIAGQNRNGIARLTKDGAIDSAFNHGASGAVRTLLVQPDGKIIVGGSFTALAGQPQAKLGRLNPDGSPDVGFNGGANNDVYCLALQTDGKIVVGGSFTTLGGQPRNYTGRLNPDGSLDAIFNPSPNSFVYALAIQEDGDILVAGWFSTVAGQSRSGLARLSNTDPANQSFELNGLVVTWTRSGSSPELYAASFEASTNGVDWFAVAGGQRVTGGWQLTGADLPGSATIRARGFYSGGQYNGSSSMTEAGAGTLAISQQPVGGNYGVGAVAAIKVVCFGATPISYQWFKDGTSLTGGGDVSGALSSTLILTNLSGADAGSYWVVVSNAFGTLASRPAQITVVEPILTSQPWSDNKSAGATASFSVSAAGTPPMYYQWRKNAMDLIDAGNVSGALDQTLTVSNVLGADAGAYAVVVSNAFGMVTSAVAVLTVVDPLLTASPRSQLLVPGQSATLTVSASGTLPLTYQWRKAGAPISDATLSALSFPSLQATDAGDYDVVLANAFGVKTSAVARLQPNQIAGDSFSPDIGGVAYPSVSALAIQPDGKILVGGNFATLCGQPCFNLGRITPEGAFDATFSCSADGSVSDLLVQPDGKIVVAGSFSKLGGQARSNLGRINPDGSVDTGFNPGGYPFAVLALQPDGKILAAGGSILRRLNSDGSGDGTFSATISGGDVFGADVYALAVQPDGKILVGGTFYSVGNAGGYLARLTTSGLADTFPAANNTVRCFALQSDGSVLVGGFFTALAGQSDSGFARVCADGSVDALFNPGASYGVNAVGIQANGKIVVGGGFTSFAGLVRGGLARLSNNEAVSETLGADDVSVAWQFKGPGPGFCRARFEISTNGTDWVVLGDGAPIPGGWGYVGACLPANCSIRARGFTAGGQYNGSGSFVESISGMAAISAPPLSRTNNAGTVATFAVLAGGTPPVSYQWLKNATPLVDGGNISGTQAPTLTLSNVLGDDAANYRVVVSNSWAAVTSVVARLVVRDPVIMSQPAGQTATPGDMVTFAVSAVGTPPLYYQWRKNGANLAGATQSALALANVQAGDAANYSAVVMNLFGSITSAVAVLTFQITPDAFNPAPNGAVTAVAVTPDGGILVGGSFTMLAGKTRNYLGRLWADGTLDTTFMPTPGSTVNCLALQTDGKVLVGGGFSTNLARLSTYGDDRRRFQCGGQRHYLYGIGATGRQNPCGWELHATQWADAELHWAVQRRRQSRHWLRRQRGRVHILPGTPTGWQNCRRRQFHRPLWTTSGLCRAAKSRRFARHNVRSGRKQHCQ